VRALKRLRVGLSRLLTGLAPTERDEHGDDDAGPEGHAIAKRKQTVPMMIASLLFPAIVVSVPTDAIGHLHPSRSTLSFAFASSIVCHCMLRGSSRPPL
jgi:hypothetical protein